MKGKISLKHGNWYVDGFPLHIDDVQQIEEDSKIFDNVEARILNTPYVEYYIEEVWETGLEETIKYAKLIPFELDEFYYHEMLDRLVLVNDMLERHILHHPVCEKHADLKENIEKAIDNLAEAYLKVPSLH